MAGPHGWEPFSTVPQGEYVEVWLAHGERGNGQIDMARVHFEEINGVRLDYNFWSYGGGNSGTDFEFNGCEIPTHWRYPRPGPHDPA